MPRPPNEVLSSHEALAAVPPDERCAALIVSLLQDEKDTAVSILIMIEVASRMAKHLPDANVRTAVSWFLAEAAAELGARWN
jgi:hypothetical protein